MDGATRRAARETARVLGERGWWLATAESCTGGLVSGALTAVSGSSAWFAGGVVAYSNAVKESLLDVPRLLLEAHGAVSREVVLAMASGAAQRFGVQCAVSVSGVAGPTGGTSEKPVGTVWLGFSVDGVATAEVHRFEGDRESVRGQSVLAALEGLVRRVG
ncbi:Nicotinamide-nucleotide amidohydrolase PncC [Fundidesulfovibrio magnetotacticus]|uniref:Nicotinamide-nucleotide amidohydrolase PncC n=1 Tax=Fundidesulfovibrio magnetotacticus TaxID=2730080 RepID=A0A6V8LUV5_9BACT|nr:CinA family protein [Fundidesulfovibrio magnetotacticus]GFK94098.1 Nicotinamide-nucleotide amidohydrolase PncC [Fundidesulfovibrio magnetotacticus]